MKLYFLCFLLVLFAVLFNPAIAQKLVEYSKAPNGLQYKLFSNGGTIKPKVGDLINVVIVYTNDKDSIIFDSRIATPINIFDLTLPSFKGGPEDAMMMMCKGDSAAFIFNADSIYIKTFRTTILPPYIKKGSKMKFYMKLLDIKSGEEKERYMSQVKEDMKKELDLKKENEQSEIEKFLALNNLSVSPLPSGLYFILKEEGKGTQVKVNEKVKIAYHCTLLNGTIIDSHLADPIEFTLGAKKVIKGLEEGVLLMKRGTKASLIIPSKLGFGEKQINNIEPYSTLIYDLEIKE